MWRTEEHCDCVSPLCLVDRRWNPLSRALRLPRVLILTVWPAGQRSCSQFRSQTSGLASCTNWPTSLMRTGTLDQDRRENKVSAFKWSQVLTQNGVKHVSFNSILCFVVAQIISQPRTQTDPSLKEWEGQIWLVALIKSECLCSKAWFPDPWSFSPVHFDLCKFTWYWAVSVEYYRWPRTVPNSSIGSRIPQVRLPCQRNVHFHIVLVHKRSVVFLCS